MQVGSGSPSGATAGAVLTTGHAAITVPGACVFAAVVCWTCMCIRGDGVCGALFRHAHPHWLRTQTPLPAPSPPPHAENKRRLKAVPTAFYRENPSCFLHSSIMQEFPGWEA